jgi:UTP--glucose-1-phosphate uridylyltransferase
MRSENLPEIVISTFEKYYRHLVQGQTGLISEADILPVDSLPDTRQFDESMIGAGEAALSKTIVLKLNGGLGTSMGLEQAKSLLEVKDGLSFLDITARQVISSGIPMVLMNSFSTQADSLAALRKYPELQGDIPLDFLQHKVPKVVQADFSPASWPADPELEWCPPGHGDIYTALVTSGMLDSMLANGYEYVFVSNADNLGAVIDTAILGYFARNSLPFMMEVADRTEADRKGGHLAKLRNGQLILRESAQCPEEDMDAFQDVNRHKYFNTNNLWINLPALEQRLSRDDNVLELSMIRNSKTVDPTDSNSTPVFQLETAMGAAIAVFENAGAVRVPRSRFAPVKTTSDLLSIRSDDYVLNENFVVVPVADRRAGPAIVSLDPNWYKFIGDLESRFPHGAPSLLDCEKFTVSGDIRFGKDITLRGYVEMVNKTAQQVRVEDGAVISGYWEA